MSIRFKFRSSVNFDTVEIGNRASISIGELRGRILKGKASQQQQQGFDLVFSDAVTGLEYESDDSQIPSGSSVIVKRVPGVTVPPTALPSQALMHVEMKECTNQKPANRPMDEFDVLGADLCPVPDSNYPEFNEDFDQNNLKGNKKDEFPGSRLECKKLDSSEPNDAMPRGSNQHGNNMNILPRIDEPSKLNKLPTNNFLAVQSSNLPLELKCSLCNHFFKDAVMIPCCQHSFCEKCIHRVLMEKGMCPKCFSRKCSVRDLLPNLSLRQAIEHFLESQMLDADIENDMHKYVPDGESGIQAKDVSCALTVVRREFELPESSSVTGKGSNQVFGEALYEQHWRNVPYRNSLNRELNPGLQSQKANQSDGVRRMHPLRNDVLRDHEDFTQSTDFQGENQPVLPQAIVHDEADSNIKRRGGLWIDSGGGGRSFSGLGGYKKGIRNCYTCGSPDHLMRDCTMSHPNSMFPPGNGAFHGGMPGYAPPYWNGSSIPPFTPYANMYSNHPMMPFSASMVPVSPWAVPPYIHSMNGSMAGPGVNMRMGNMGPPRADHVGLQHCGNKKRKHSNENLGSEQLSDEKDGSSECYRHNHPEKAHDHKSQEDRESSLSHSDDNSLSRGLGRKYHHDKHFRSDVHYADERHEKSYRASFSGRDKRLPHIERSNSGKENSGRSSDRHRHHHHGESKQYDERRGHYESDSSLGNRPAPKDIKRQVESNAQGSHKRHQSLQSESGFEPNTPVDRKVGHKEREHRDDRWKMVSSSDKDRRDEHRYHKRRVH